MTRPTTRELTRWMSELIGNWLGDALMRGELTGDEGFDGVYGARLLSGGKIEVRAGEKRFEVTVKEVTK